MGARELDRARAEQPIGRRVEFRRRHLGELPVDDLVHERHQEIDVVLGQESDRERRRGRKQVLADARRQ